MGLHHKIQRPTSDMPTSGVADIASAAGAANEGLDWHRTRIQRIVLEKFGTGRAELWRAAIKLMFYVRQSAARCETFDPNYVFVDKLSQHADAVDEEASTSSSQKRSGQETSYAASLSHSKEPSNGPARPHSTAVLVAPGARLRASRGLQDMSAERMGKKLRALPHAKAEVMIGRVPESLFLKIAGFAAGSHELLSEQQTRGIIRYAQDRKTLHAELERLGKAKSHQMWCVLELVNCLVYEDELERPNSISEDL